jgi:hypothetical protein
MRVLSCIVVFAATTLAFAEPTVVSVEKIWEQGAHNAFTDLLRHNDTWYCVFREAAGHVKGNGGIRIIASSDGESVGIAGIVAGRRH